MSILVFPVLCLKGPQEVLKPFHRPKSSGFSHINTSCLKYLGSPRGNDGVKPLIENAFFLGEVLKKVLRLG
jgi:hypothetical protein